MYIVGDTHGFFGLLLRTANTGLTIQVGDIGFWPSLRKDWVRPENPVYFIEGNHDRVPDLVKLEMVTEVWPNLFYVPRGTVLELEGKQVAFCGGAKSVDYKWRAKGIDWFDEEQVTLADVERFTEPRVPSVDLLITHTPPDWVIRKNFPQSGLQMFGIDPWRWVNESARNIQAIHDSLGRPKRPQLYCGHMHKALIDGPVRILGIDEVVYLEPS